MKMKSLIEEFIKLFPEIEVVIGYGSGVKKQANDKGLHKQIDLILVVKDKMKWHQETYERHPEFYNKLGYKLLPLYQNIGTNLDYLTYLPFEGKMFKIGVISVEHALDDLLHWKNFYFAGRLQKDVEIIKSNPTFDNAIRTNRLNALKTALLLSDKEFLTEQKLYELLCSLSFIGDWRNILHIETPNKIPNIVNGSFDGLHHIYTSLNNGYYDVYPDYLLINYSQIIDDLELMPISLLSKLEQVIDSDNISKETLMHLRKIIISHFKVMNLKASAAQPVKGLLLNGVQKTYSYLNAKISKSKF